MRRGSSGIHGQRRTEEKRIHLDLKRFFYRNSGEDQRKNKKKFAPKTGAICHRIKVNKKKKVFT